MAATAAERNQQRELFDLWEETREVYGRILKHWDLSENTFYTLYHLREAPEGLEPAVIAGKLGVRKQSVTPVLNELEQRGYISRQERQDDHRRKRIRLSAAGVEFSTAMCEEVEAIDGEALATFSAEERRLLLEFSRRYCLALRASLARMDQENQKRSGV